MRRKPIVLLIFIVFYIALSGFTSTFYNYTPHKVIVVEQRTNKAINSVLELIDQANYEEAMHELEKISKLDTLISNYNSEKFNLLISNYKKILIRNVNNYVQNNEHRLAVNLINSKLRYYEKDENINALLKASVTAIESEKLVEYTGVIEHIYTKSLLAYPEKALDPSNINYIVNDTQHLTPYEFEKILTQLYQKNYVLVDINSLFKVINSKIEKQPLLLPANKKPLLMSFEDISYNNENGGKIDKIILDRNNNLATYTSKKSINDRVSYNNEYVTILENFISNHPDFSHHNARGVICLTGYDGILGYKTQKTNATSKYEIKNASKVVSKLKSLGWRFACNGYSHKDMKTISDMDFTKEISKWKSEVEPIIGPTLTYAYPYSELTLYDEHGNLTYKQKLLQEYGFKLFLSGDNENNFNYINGTVNSIIVLSLKNLTADSIRNNAQEFNHLFNNSITYDYEFRKTPLNTTLTLS